MSFNGSINRLIVVAGPSGCGKSSFLDNPLKYIDPLSIPDELHNMEINAPRHTELSYLQNYSGPDIDDLWIHFDMLQPFRLMPTVNTGTFHKIINKGFSKSCGGLKFLGRAKEIHFLTLYTDRKIAARRFIDRQIEIAIHRVTNEKIADNNFRRFFKLPIKKISNRGAVTLNIANIYGSDSQSETLYNALYDAWFEYTDSQAGKSYWIMNANETPYKITKGNSIPESDKL